MVKILSESMSNEEEQGNIPSPSHRTALPRQSTQKKHLVFNSRPSIVHFRIKT